MEWRSCRVSFSSRQIWSIKISPNNLNESLSDHKSHIVITVFE
jgi:hypothetical protein